MKTFIGHFKIAKERKGVLYYSILFQTYFCSPRTDLVNECNSLLLNKIISFNN